MNCPGENQKGKFGGSFSWNSAWILKGERSHQQRSCTAGDSREKLCPAPRIMNLNWARVVELKKLFMSHNKEGERLEQMPWVRSISSIHAFWHWAARKDEIGQPGRMKYFIIP